MLVQDRAFVVIGYPKGSVSVLCLDKGICKPSNDTNSELDLCRANR
jgi:hypothetical protein